MQAGAEWPSFARSSPWGELIAVGDFVEGANGEPTIVSQQPATDEWLSRSEIGRPPSRRRPSTSSRCSCIRSRRSSRATRARRSARRWASSSAAATPSRASRRARRSASCSATSARRCRSTSTYLGLGLRAATQNVTLAQAAELSFGAELASGFASAGLGARLRLPDGRARREPRHQRRRHRRAARKSMFIGFAPLSTRPPPPHPPTPSNHPLLSLALSPQPPPSPPPLSPKTLIIITSNSHRPSALAQPPPPPEQRAVRCRGVVVAGSGRRGPPRGGGRRLAGPPPGPAPRLVWPRAPPGPPRPGGHMITVGDVDGANNGFDPTALLTDWDTGDRLAPAGRRARCAPLRSPARTRRSRSRRASSSRPGPTTAACRARPCASPRATACGSCSEQRLAPALHALPRHPLGADGRRARAPA